MMKLPWQVASSVFNCMVTYFSGSVMCCVSFLVFYLLILLLNLYSYNINSKFDDLLQVFDIG